MSEFYALLTRTGEAKLAASLDQGERLKITTMVVGDANGTNPNPNQNWTSLLHEVYRAPLNLLRTQPDNPSAILAEMVIPAAEGGWWLRELGLLDEDGDLVAVGKCPPTYKPLLAEGSGRVQGIRMIIVVDNADAIELILDPTLVMATRDYVDSEILLAEQRIEDQRLAGIELTRDSIGFPTRLDTRLVFDNASRTVTLEALSSTYDVYYFGRRITLETLSIQVDDISGGRYIILDADTLELREGGQYPGFDQLLVAYIYWSQEQQQFLIHGDERHSVQRDTTWHRAQHNNQGMVWRTGGQPQFIPGDPAQVSFGLVGPIRVADEDLEHTIIHSDTPDGPFQQQLEGVGRFPILHVTAAETYEQVAPSEYPFLFDSNGILYNPVDTETNIGSLSSVPDGKFVSMFVMASHCQHQPVKLIAGREVWDSAAEAQGESLLAYGLNFPEFSYLYQLVFERDNTITENPGQVRLAQVFEAARPVSSATQPAAIGSHESLSDRSRSDQHPISAISGLQDVIDTLQQAMGNASFPSGTRMLFVQEAAPVGWTKVTTHDNKALRIVSGNGGGSGGAMAFTTAFNTGRTVSVTVNNHTLTTAQMPSHAHNIRTYNWEGGDHGSRVSSYATNGGGGTAATNTTGGGSAHNHGASGSLNLNVQYVDAFIAEKD